MFCRRWDYSWPILLILFCLFILSVKLPRGWERIARPAALQAAADCPAAPRPRAKLPQPPDLDRQPAIPGGEFRRVEPAADSLSRWSRHRGPGGGLPDSRLRRPDVAVETPAAEWLAAPEQPSASDRRASERWPANGGQPSTEWRRSRHWPTSRRLKWRPSLRRRRAADRSGV